MTKQEYAKQSREMVSAVGPWTIGSRAPLFDIPKDWNPFRPGRKHEEWNDGFDSTNESLDAMHNNTGERPETRSERTPKKENGNDEG